MAKYDQWLTSEGLLRIEGWARDGLTDAQIAHNMGIRRETLIAWKKKYPNLDNTLKKGKEVVDREVENALFKRAIGYRTTEVIKERLVDTGQKKRHGGESELTEREWDFAIKYFKRKCCYCGEELTKATKDHVKPLSAGGALNRYNTVPCCGSCNSSKKNHDMETWYRGQKFFSEARLEKIYDYLELVNDVDELLPGIQGELVVTKEIEKEVMPDVTAQIFWLKNRKPAEWRDKQQIEHSGEVSDKLSDIMNQLGGEGLE